jgi:hypothetical protein
LDDLRITKDNYFFNSEYTIQGVPPHPLSVKDLSFKEKIDESLLNKEVEPPTKEYLDRLNNKLLSLLD